MKFNIKVPSKNFLTVLFFLLISAFFFIMPKANKVNASSITESDLINLTNQKRQENGVGSLSQNSALSRAAQDKANDMVAKNYFSHNPPDGSSVWTFIQKEGYSYSAIAENIAEGFTTSSDVINAWMNSSGHRANMINGTYKDAGFGIADGSLNGRTTTVVVGEYGLSRGSSVSIPTPTQTILPTNTPTPTRITYIPAPTAVHSTPTIPPLTEQPTFTPTPTIPPLAKQPTATYIPKPTKNQLMPTRIIIKPTHTPTINNVRINSKNQSWTKYFMNLFQRVKIQQSNNLLFSLITFHSI